MRNAVLAALTILAAGPALAADWRAVPVYGRDLGFVDADSVRRTADGRIRFKARFLLADPDPADDFGYDSYDLDAAADCLAAGDEMKVAGARRFRFRGRPAKPDDWIVEEANSSGASAAKALCGGVIGYRRFARPEDALGEYRDNRNSVERLLAYVTPEAELTGTAVQGFEMDGISLCGSELGCAEGAPFEFCWLESDIHVPVPADAREEQIRRDTADYAFRGRIFRSPTGRGFGHLRAAGCLAEATGPARPAVIPKQPEQPQRPDPGIGEAAIAAHKRLEEAMRGAGAVTAVQAGNSWRIDELKARPAGWQGACGSDLMFEGKSLEPYPTAINWGGVERISVGGPRLEITTSQWSGIQFHAGTAAEAEKYRKLLDELGKSGVVSAAQKGREVTVRTGINTHHGPIFSRTFRRQEASAADAVRLAGMVEALRNQEIHSFSRRGRDVSALKTRRVMLTFESEDKARPVESAMRELMRVCGPTPES